MTGKSLNGFEPLFLGYEPNGLPLPQSEFKWNKGIRTLTVNIKN